MCDSRRLSTRRVVASALRHIAVSGIFLSLAATSTSAAEWHSNRALTAGNPNLVKVSSHLLRARLLAADGRAAAQIAVDLPVLQLRDGMPEVEIRFDTLTPELLDKLRSLGLDVTSYHLGYGRAYGRLDLAKLKGIAALPEVVTIQPMPRRGTRVGAAYNQGDATMNADDVRSTFGYDGTGVRVGILSDSFNSFGGGSITGSGCSRTVTGTLSQGSDDLPAAGGEVFLLDDGPGGGSDEGRALGELIFDVVPDATFSFHSAFNSPADFADGITELVGCGANLIVDDVFWTQQAFFQDDIIAQAAQGAVDAGVPFFSAAGNDATFGIDDVFLDTDADASACAPSGFKLLPNDDDLHDFGSGDHFAGVTLPDGCNIHAELQWAEPFDSIGSSPGAASDLDLFLLSSPMDPASTSGSNFLAESTTFQGCGVPAANFGDPFEQIFYENTTGATQDVFFAVDNCCGDPSVRFRIVNLSFNCSTTVPPFDFEDGFDISGGLPVPDASETPIFDGAQIFGHPSARGVVAVAAAFFPEVGGIPGFVAPGDLDPPTGQIDVEAFSSLGGNLPFFFDGNGDPLPTAPEHRFKPEVTGPDGTDTTFFGADIDDFFEPPGNGNPNFFGTSAAAPNSAAIAALILDATDLKINPLPLKQLLRQSAIDIETPGPDNLSGDGFTDALRSIRSLDDSTTPLIDDLDFDLDGESFFSSPPSGGLQRVQALDTLMLRDGDFSGLDGLADTIIFADGFESGDTSAWSN